MKYWVLTVGGDLWYFDTIEEMQEGMKGFPLDTWKYGSEND